MTRIIPMLGASALSLLLAFGLVGCAADVARLDDPTLDGELAGAGFHQISRHDWESAEAGCEDAPIDELELVACEGEPALGALVDDEGKVVCVDAMSALQDDLFGPAPDPLAADPSPQPSHPGRMAFERSSAKPTSGQAQMAVVLADPTPTPVVQEDPTPTPVTNPDLALRFVFLPEMPDEEDPTPTPTTEE